MSNRNRPIEVSASLVYDQPRISRTPARAPERASARPTMPIPQNRPPLRLPMNSRYYEFPPNQRQYAMDLGPEYINFHFDRNYVEYLINRDGLNDATIENIFNLNRLTYPQMMALYPWLRELIPENLLNRYRYRRHNRTGSRDTIENVNNNFQSAENPYFQEDLTNASYSNNIPNSLTTELSDYSNSEPLEEFRGYTLTENSSQPSIYSNSPLASDYSSDGAGLKKKKTKINNRWINHVKQYSKKNNVPYNIALKLAKSSY
jgi:hypothetical protein